MTLGVVGIRREGLLCARRDFFLAPGDSPPSSRPPGALKTKVIPALSHAPILHVIPLCWAAFRRRSLGEGRDQVTGGWEYGYAAKSFGDDTSICGNTGIAVVWSNNRGSSVSGGSPRFLWDKTWKAGRRGARLQTYGLPRCFRAPHSAFFARTDCPPGSRPVRAFQYCCARTDSAWRSRPVLACGGGTSANARRSRSG